MTATPPQTRPLPKPKPKTPMENRFESHESRKQLAEKIRHFAKIYKFCYDQALENLPGVDEVSISDAAMTIFKAATQEEG